MTVMPTNRYHRARAEELLAGIAADAHTEREVTAVMAGCAELDRPSRRLR